MKPNESKRNKRINTLYTKAYAILYTKQMLIDLAIEQAQETDVSDESQLVILDKIAELDSDYEKVKLALRAYGENIE